MERDQAGGLGSGGGSGRIPNRIFRGSSPVGSHEGNSDPDRFGEEGGSRIRNTGVGQERRSPHSSLGKLFALPIDFLSHPEASGGVETHYQSKTVEQGFHRSDPFSYGVPGKHHPASTSRYVGSLVGPDRCVSTHSDASRLLPLPGIQVSGGGLCVQRSAVRPIDGTKGLHKGYSGGGFTLKKPGDYRLRLSRRLADCGSVGSGRGKGCGTMSVSLDGVRVDHKLGEVRPGSFSGHSLSRSASRLQSRGGLSVREKVSEDQRVSESVSIGAVSPSVAMVEAAGVLSESHGDSSLVSSTYESASNSSSSILQSSERSSHKVSRVSRVSSSTCALVDSSSEHSSRSSVPGYASSDLSYDGRFSDRLGGVLGRQNDFGSMERPRIVSSHQLAGVGDSQVGNFALASASSESQSHCVHRQHGNCSLHQSRGGYTLVDAVRPGDRSADSVPRQQHQSSGITFGRGRQYDGRRLVQRHFRRERVDSGSTVGGRFIPTLRSPTHRPVCNESQSSSSNVLQQDLRDGGHADGRPVIQLGGPLRLRVSSEGAVAQGTIQDRGVRSNGDLGRPLLAKPAMVPVSDETSSRRPSQVPGGSGLGLARAGSSSTSRPSGSASVCLEAFRRRLSQEGLREETIDIAAKARRLSTIRTYDSRLERFYKWCTSHDTDPVEASLKAVTDFLVHLFQSDLLVVTIKHYRSAIAAIHSGFPDGSTISNNDIISSLIKGMFHSRPPVRRLAPSWSINEVLTGLAGPPYEPLSSIPLLQLTLKTVFLIAAASARRRSTVHALTIKEGFMRFSPSGVSLLPDPAYLAKNHTMAFTPEPIFISKLSMASATREDKYWCPVRALSWYVKRTEGVRTTDQLFIQSRSPYGPASKATLSGWLVRLIKELVKTPVGVKAHDLRGQAASKAWFARVPMEDILKAASWKTPTTFVACYLTDTVSAETSFSRAVLSVSGRDRTGPPARLALG